MNVQPSVAEYDGTYNYDARKHILQWNIPIIDKNNTSGSMEFSCNSSISGDFFPLQVCYIPEKLVLTKLTPTICFYLG